MRIWHQGFIEWTSRSPATASRPCTWRACSARASASSPSTPTSSGPSGRRRNGRGSRTGSGRWCPWPSRIATWWRTSSARARWWRPSSRPPEALVEAARLSAPQVIDARHRLVLPGAIDAHFHVGIYRPLAEDAERETASALVGGVTTVLTCFRTGSHYLNRTGPVPPDLPRGARDRRGPLPHRLRLPRGRHDRPADRRGGLARHERGRRLLQVLHVLRRAQPRGRLDAGLGEKRS